MTDIDEEKTQNIHPVEWTITVTGKVPDFDLTFAKYQITVSGEEWEKMDPQEFVERLMSGKQETLKKPACKCGKGNCQE